MKRFNPLASTPAPKKETAAPVVEKANHNSIDDVARCVDPDCKKPMRTLYANKILCHVCVDHRVVFPCKNKE